MAYTVDYGVPSDEVNLTTAQDGKIYLFTLNLRFIEKLAQFFSKAGLNRGLYLQ